MIDTIDTTFPKVLRVSDLTALAKETLESHIPLCWVSGEISNFTRAASGHWYFSLKDARAQVRCVMFKGRNSYLDYIPKEGDSVEARATVTLYEARGDFQLTIEFMQVAGLGRLYEAYEALKQALQAEGLFASERKQVIPAEPRAIGVVTSADAAALRDVLAAIQRRAPHMRVIIYPTPVQGKGAAQLIANAIALADQRQEVDTLLVVRGGGSIEDLWSFNEAVVARAIAACRIPIISGVGHETDVTIADFVADMRAATPTAAAELACPDVRMRIEQLHLMRQRLQRAMRSQLQQRAQTLDYLSRRLIAPEQQLKQQQRICSQLHQRLALAMTQTFSRERLHLKSLQQSLQQLNPTNVLARGYAIVQTERGAVVVDASQLSATQTLQLTLHRGSASVQVVATQPEQPLSS